jgi:hypothetical protein
MHARLLVPIVAALIVTGCTTTTTDPATTPTTTTSAAAPAASEPAPTPEGPALTVGQEQAIQSAESYLDMGGFSEKGLLKQLTSEYGEGFEVADAKFAIAFLKPDWNAQAVKSAESYMDMGGFSRAELLDQLTSEYGEQFTKAQALYALKAVGY